MDQKTTSIELKSGNVITLTVTEMPGADPLVTLDLWRSALYDPAEVLGANEIYKGHIAENEMLAHCGGES